MSNLAENLVLLFNKDMHVALRDKEHNSTSCKNDINLIVEKFNKASDKDIVYPIFFYDTTKYFCIKLTPDQDEKLDIKYTLKIKLIRDEETFICCFFRHNNIYKELAEQLSSLKFYGVKITEDTVIEILDNAKPRDIDLEGKNFSYIKKYAAKKKPKKEVEYWEYSKENDDGTYAISRYLIKNLFPIPISENDYSKFADKQIEQIEENNIQYTGLYLNLAEMRTIEGLLRLVYSTEYRFTPPQYKFLISKRTFHSLVGDFRAEETLQNLKGKLFLYRGMEFIVAPVIESLEIKGKSYLITLNQYFLKDLCINKSIDTGSGFEIRKAGFYHHKLNYDLAFTGLLNYMCWACVQHPKNHFILCSMKKLLKSVGLYDVIKKQSKPFVLKKLNKYFDCLFSLGYIEKHVEYSIRQFEELLKNGQPLKIKINKTNLFMHNISDDKHE